MRLLTEHRAVHTGQEMAHAIFILRFISKNLKKGIVGKIPGAHGGLKNTRYDKHMKEC